MIPNKDTKLYFSVSSNPGNFGATIYNAVFEYLNLNAVYVPVKLADDCSFGTFLKTCTAISVAGISVSMPFKKEVYVNCLSGDDFTVAARNGNTVTIEQGVQFGYNTDAIGFQLACEKFLENSKTAIIVGSGAVSDTISVILDRYDINYHIVKRSETYPLSGYEADFLINATPIGMNDLYKDTIFTKDVVKNYKHVFDVVVNNNTNLLNLSRDLKKDFRSGVSMIYYGIIKQFQIYTRQTLPEKFLLEKINNMGLTYEKLQ
jgi:shikimate 5-dehydrogenase